MIQTLINFALAIILVGGVYQYDTTNHPVQPKEDKPQPQAVVAIVPPVPSPTPTPTPVSTAPSREDIFQEIELVWNPAGDEAVKRAQKIAFCESSFIGTNTNGQDHGLFAIRYIHNWTKGKLLDWRRNIRIAYALYERDGWRPWNASKTCWAERGN